MKFARDKIDTYWPKWREDIQFQIDEAERPQPDWASPSSRSQVEHMILKNQAVIMKALWWLLHPEKP